MTIILGLLFAGQAAAQAPALTLDRATELFLERNVEIEAARFRVERARAERIAARMRPNPSLTIAMENLSVRGSVQFEDLYELSATYSDTIERGGKRRLRESVAAFTLTAAEQALNDVLRQKTGELQRAFFEALLAQRILDAEMSNRDTLDQIVRLNTDRLEAGAISEGELLKTRLERARADSAVRQAQLGQARAMIQLLEKLEEPDLGVRAVAGSFDTPLLERAEVSLSSLRERAMTTRPDLNAARSERDLAAERIALERARSAPDLMPYAGYKRIGSNHTVMFGLTIPLSTRNRNEGGVARAVGDEKVARGQIEVARNRVAVDVEMAYRAYEGARDQVIVFRDQLVRQATEAETIALAAYEEGATDLLGVLEAQRTRLEVEKEYLDRQCDLRLSLIDLELAVGERIQP
jgi:cobalt-zinc-cadmium efflux system outer membrane protein